MKRSIHLSLIFLFFSLGLFAQEIAQWRGPHRNGRYPENNLLKEWPQNGPEQLWSIEGIGTGYSSVSVGDGIIYATGFKDSLDYLTALDINGNVQWQIPYGRGCRRSYRETRSTPTVEANRVYVISGRGEVVCIDGKQGKKLWSVDAYTKFQGNYATWEIAESPLIVDDKVIYTPGGDNTTMVALDKHNGETIWMTETLHDSSAYVSPLLVNYKNKKMIVNVIANHIFGVDAQSGRFLWTYRYGDIERPTWHFRAPVINCNTPVYHDGHIYVTSGYNHVGAMFKLSPDGDDVTLAWIDSTLDTHHGGVVLIDGYIYGSNWINNSQGNWVCLNWDTGEPMYEKRWNTKGSIIWADGLLYCLEERRGHMALVRPSPADFDVIGSFRITEGSGPYWAHPVIHNGVLFIRHGDVLMAYDIGH